jgi:hypothetical protein
MDKTYKQHGKSFKYLTKMLWRARVLPAKTALPKFSSNQEILEMGQNLGPTEL